jgi:hypothetical protein
MSAIEWWERLSDEDRNRFAQGAFPEPIEGQERRQLVEAAQAWVELSLTERMGFLRAKRWGSQVAEVGWSTNVRDEFLDWVDRRIGIWAAPENG